MQINVNRKIHEETNLVAILHFYINTFEHLEITD